MRKNITGEDAFKLLSSGEVLRNFDVKGTLKLLGDDKADEWLHELQIQDCIIEELQFCSFAKPVIFEDTHFKKVDTVFPYFLAGLTIRNCTFDSYLDLQCGGHNRNGTEVRIEGNHFKSFVNFFDDWFEGPVTLRDNTFDEGTNFLSKTLMITFDVPPAVSGNGGQLDIEGEKEELRSPVLIS